MQHQRHSFIESTTKATIGFLTAVASQVIIYPQFDIPLVISDMLIIGMFFTIISSIRGYYTRRLFNKFNATGKQTRAHSIIETVIDTVIGYAIAVASQIIIFPLFDMIVTFWEHFQMGLLFMVVAITRSYIVRRLFVHHTEQEI